MNETSSISSSLTHLLPALADLNQKEGSLSADCLNQMLLQISLLGEMKGALKHGNQQLGMEVKQLQIASALPPPPNPSDERKILAQHVRIKIQAIYEQAIKEQNFFDSMCIPSQEHSDRSWRLNLVNQNEEEGKLYAIYIYSNQFLQKFKSIAVEIKNAQDRLDVFFCKFQRSAPRKTDCKKKKSG